MPINRLALKNLAERDVEDLLRRKPENIETAIAGTKETSLASRERFKNLASDVAGETAAGFGLPPDISQAAGAQAGRVSEDLKRAETESLDFRRLNERKEALGRTFDFMYDRLLNAGVDRTQAENVARRFALDEDERRSVSEQKETGRQNELKRQDILEEFAQNRMSMEEDFAREQRKQAFKRSIYQSLSSFGGAVAGGLIARKI